MQKHTEFFGVKPPQSEKPQSISSRAFIAEVTPPVEVVNNGEHIVFRIKKQQQENDGFEGKFNEEMQEVSLAALKDGQLDSNVTIKREKKIKI